MYGHDPSRPAHWRRTRNTAHRHRRAFSLLELSIILAIMAVLSAIAVPRYLSSMDQYHLDAAARRVIDDLALARNQARAAGVPQTVIFGGSPDTYLLQGVADPDRGTASTTVHLDEAPYEVTITAATFDDPLDVGDGLNTVIFDGYGQPDSDGTVTLARGAGSIQVVLNADSGEADVP